MWTWIEWAMIIGSGLVAVGSTLHTILWQKARKPRVHYRYRKLKKGPEGE